MDYLSLLRRDRLSVMPNVDWLLLQLHTSLDPYFAVVVFIKGFRKEKISELIWSRRKSGWKS